MKVCLVAPRFSYPENGGDVVLLNDIMHYLKDKGYEVVLISFYKESQLKELEVKHPYIDKLICVKHNKLIAAFYTAVYFFKGKPLQCGYYYSPQMENTIRRVLKEEKPDLLVCHLLRMLPYFEHMGIKDNLIVQMSDILSNTYRLSKVSKGYFFKKLIYSIEESRIRNYEDYTINNYRKIVLVSENDKNSLKDNPNIYYHNNGIRQIIDNGSYDDNKIVFVGNMRTLQNLDGCLHFIKDIFPKILKVKPECKLYVVGFADKKALKRLEYPNVIVTGYVESVEDCIKDAAISVAPIRVASGIQNKVLMSMACNVPVVLSSLIAKGITGACDGKNCFIRDDDTEFADTCIELMNNSSLRKSTAEAASSLVRDNYFWNLHLKDYEVIK